MESIFDRSDAATANNIHQNKTLLLPYEEYAFVSQLSASEPRVVRSVPASIEVSSAVQDSGIVTYTPIDDEVYPPLPTVTPVTPLIPVGPVTPVTPVTPVAPATPTSV